MVAGHLAEKKGMYYAVLNVTDFSGKYKKKWVASGLPVKGNKKRAEAFLLEQRKKYENYSSSADGILFADYMIHWLEIAKSTITPVTYSGYYKNVMNVIVPYFRERKITLMELKPSDIQDFYLVQLRRVKAASVLKYHANIHKALKYAVRTELIPSNPCDKIDRPKQDKFVGNYYTSEEINTLFEVSKGTILEIPILFGAFYGLRRSEVIGLKWNAFDFEKNVFVIRHTVNSITMDGKRQMIEADRTKNQSSMRTLPLVPFVKHRLEQLRQEQENNRKLCGRSYNKQYSDYVCVDAMGNLIDPHHVTGQFPKLLERNGLRRIRFHDLRHSCASLLLSNNVPMKQIQEWLGHSDFSTTANIYAHLDTNAKWSSADALLTGLGIDDEDDDDEDEDECQILKEIKKV